MRSASCPTREDFHKLVEHFLALSSQERLARFGELLSAADICAYVEGLLREPQCALVVRDPQPDLAGVMHLEFRDGAALLGLSVAGWARSQGIGSLLLDGAVSLARARGLNMIYMRNLSGNPPLRRLLLLAGINIAWAPDASSTQLDLPVAKPRFPGGAFGKRGVTFADYVFCTAEERSPEVPVGGAAPRDCWPATPGRGA